MKVPKSSKIYEKVKKQMKPVQSTLFNIKKDSYKKDLKESAPYQDTYKITMWNINGIRAILKRDSFTNYLKCGNFDIICFNETKINHEKLMKSEIQNLNLWKGYNQLWSFSTKKPGYAGTAIFSKQKPLSHKMGIGLPSFDEEGRTITIEYPEFYLVVVYVPNAGPKCIRLEEKTKVWGVAFNAYLKSLKDKKKTIVVGDFNVAHKEIDLHDPKGNVNSGGYTVEERESFQDLLDLGFKDGFREFHPKKVQYSWWSALTKTARPNNKGWRIDYCVADENALPLITDVKVRDDVYGSDHCPIEVFWDKNNLKTK